MRLRWIFLLKAYGIVHQQPTKYGPLINPFDDSFRLLIKTMHIQALH